LGTDRISGFLTGHVVNGEIFKNTIFEKLKISAGSHSQGYSVVLSDPHGQDEQINEMTCT
jgi:uncharacterized protein YbjQ (UPF0145 family)